MRFASLVLLLSLAAGCSGPQTGEPAARAALDASAEAMGGWEALRAVRSMRLVSSGADHEPLQAMEPGAPLHIVDFKSVVAVDFAQPAIRVEYNTDILWPRAFPNAFTEVIQGEVGMLDHNNAQSRLHPGRYAARIRDIHRMAARVLLTASEASGLTRLEDETVGGTALQVIEYQDSGLKVRLRIDSATHLPESVAYLEDDPILGDNWNLVTWSDWRNVGDIKQPYALKLTLNDILFHEETFQEIEINPALPESTFAIPDEIRQTPEEGERYVSQWVPRRVVSNVTYLDTYRPPRVQFDELAPGFWQVGIASHQTFVIEMRDHLILVEAPLYEERSQAVIQAVKEKFPDKPMRYMILTHWHLDHSGGSRAYAAEGLTFVGSPTTLGHLRTMFARPKTVKPDALARRVAAEGKLPEIAMEEVDSVREFTDGTRVVRIYPVQTMHAKGFLSTYLPKEKIIIEADLVSDTMYRNPPILEERAVEYYDWLQTNKIPVDRIARVHGKVVPFREFRSIVEKNR